MKRKEHIANDQAMKTKTLSKLQALAYQATTKPNTLNKLRSNLKNLDTVYKEDQVLLQIQIVW